MKNLLLLDNQKAAERISNFLRREFKKRNKSCAILGLSGGIDSTLTAFLCHKAGLDLYPIILPYRGKGLNGLKVAEVLNLPKDHIITIDIGLFVDSAVKELQRVIKINRIDKGNIMARQRMIIQYTLARQLNGLVVGTENLSEYYLGYFTLYGDQACDISPIGGLFKTQVYQLAKYLGIPNWILEKKPTAGLWPGQTDEKELGFSYQEADPILYWYCIKKLSPSKIIKKGLKERLVKKVIARVNATEFKRHPILKQLFKQNLCENQFYPL